MIYYIISVVSFVQIEEIFRDLHLFSFCLVVYTDLFNQKFGVVWLIYLNIFFPPFKISILLCIILTGYTEAFVLGQSFKKLKIGFPSRFGLC